MKVLMIDNFDSFTYNLVQYFEIAGAKVITCRNDAGLQVVEKEKPDLIAISPGPSTPQNAGISMELIQKYGGQYPMFGVCLGMQAIAEAFGVSIRRLDDIVHGGASEIHHDGRTIFTGLPNPFPAGRYHSLGTLDKDGNGQDVFNDSPLEISATTPNPYNNSSAIVMGVRHKHYPIEGVQFHPESVLTMKDGAGFRIIKNALEHLIAKHINL